MDTATLEPPQHQEAAPAPKRIGRIPALAIDRQAIKIASCAGIDDQDIARQHPGLQPATIRKWRQRDKQWSTAYYALRKGTSRGATPKHLQQPRPRHNQTQEQANHEHDAKEKSRDVTLTLLAQGIPEVAHRNRIRLAYEVDRALAKRTKSKKALPIASFAELNQAARALLYAEGRDADAPALTLNVWGNPGLQAQQSTGGFRDLPAIDAETNAGA
jgi:hypothetical protein